MPTCVAASLGQCLQAARSADRLQYMNLSEELTLQEQVNRLPNGFNGVNTTAASAVVTDVFRTENHFNGGQIGLIGEMRRGRWYIDGTLKVAAQVTRTQMARINGSQVITNTNGVVTAVPGGCWPCRANIGTFNQNKFAVVPEATMNVGYHITPNLRVLLGYNFLYASSVLRPADQIDTNLDVTRIRTSRPRRRS
ncbi:MAG: BBP7 family outer membrane beta-barrel protein [Gemmataceae bacterium]